jgi:leader peptidase (prepilin peptidase)/N-methyltransferase
MLDPAERLLATLSSGLLGLAIGSFLNVVAYRLPRGMSVVRPRSRCPTCETELTSKDNVPVLSWLALRGRCRHCSGPVSVRYPLVELATGLLFAGTAAAASGEALLAPLLLVEAAAIAAASIDFDGKNLPWPVVAASLLGSMGLWAVAAAEARPAAVAWAAGAGIAGAVLWGAGEAVAGRARAVTTIGLPLPAGSARSAAGGGATGRTLLVAAMAAAVGWLWPAGGWGLVLGAALSTIAARGWAPRRALRRLPLVPMVVLFAGLVLAGAAR